MSTSEGKCVLVEVGALISWCIYSYRIVMLLVPYVWASMTFLPVIQLTMTSPEIYDFVLKNILSQNKHTKVTNYLLLTNEGAKPEKRLKKD